MQRSKYIVAGLAVLQLCITVHAVRADEEMEIPLSAVPDAVLTAVRNARADIRIDSAARRTDGSGILYEIEGDVGGEELEFVVSPDGNIMETDKE